MRFRIGEMPTDSNFNPEDTKWNKVKLASSFPSFFLYSSICAFIIFSLFSFFWLLADMDPMSPSWFTLLLIPLLILVHEIIHAVSYPDFGLSEKTIIGFWPNKMLAYAYYTAPLSRNRLIWVGIAPFLFLSLFPLLLFIALGGASFWGKTISTFLFQLSMLNAIFSSGDILGIVIVLLEIPPSGIIRFNGWDTFWKSRQ